MQVIRESWNVVDGHGDTLCEAIRFLDVSLKTGALFDRNRGYY
jgi:hypothetical protein